MKLSFYRDSQTGGKPERTQIGMVYVSGITSALDCLEAIEAVANMFEHKGIEDLVFSLKEDHEEEITGLNYLQIWDKLNNC
jgi:hypothetical protein